MSNDKNLTACWRSDGGAIGTWWVEDWQANGKRGLVVHGRSDQMIKMGGLPFPAPSWSGVVISDWTDNGYVQGQMTTLPHGAKGLQQFDGVQHETCKITVSADGNELTFSNPSSDPNDAAKVMHLTRVTDATDENLLRGEVDATIVLRIEGQQINTNSEPVKDGLVTMNDSSQSVTITFTPEARQCTLRYWCATPGYHIAGVQLSTSRLCGTFGGRNFQEFPSLPAGAVGHTGPVPGTPFFAHFGKQALLLRDVAGAHAQSPWYYRVFLSDGKRLLGHDPQIKNKSTGGN